MLKKYCKSGHAFTLENTYVRPSNGKRSCRICLRRKAKRRRESHPEETRQYLQRWYRNNKEYANSKKALWAKENLEKEQARKRKWAKKNPEPFRKAARKRRALKKSQLGLWNQFEEQIISLLRLIQGGCCFYCQVPVSSDLPPQAPQREILEHPQPLSRGGTHGINNWVLSCFSCNSKKGNKTIAEFLEI